MSFKFREDNFSINVQDKEYEMVITEDEFFDRLEEMTKLSEEAREFNGAEQIRKLIFAVKSFTNYAFGEGAFESMTEGVKVNISVAMQLFEYIVRAEREYFEALKERFTVERLKV